jgi:hypothetical protein
MICGVKILRLDLLFLLYQDKRKESIVKQKKPIPFGLGLSPD